MRTELKSLSTEVVLTWDEPVFAGMTDVLGVSGREPVLMTEATLHVKVVDGKPFPLAFNDGSIVPMRGYVGLGGDEQAMALPVYALPIALQEELAEAYRATETRLAAMLS